MSARYTSTFIKAHASMLLDLGADADTWPSLQYVHGVHEMLSRLGYLAFLQSGWSAALCAALTLIVSCAVFAYRIRDLKIRIRNAAEQRHADRERLARDLHDTLLQGIHALLYRVEVWEADAAMPVDRRREIALVIRQVRALMIEGRDRIALLRRSEIGHQDLLSAVRAVASLESYARAVAFEIVSLGAEESLAPEGFGQLLDIIKEAIVNAFRHALAARILVRIEYQRTALRVEIKDDGVGIDPHSQSGERANRHFGILGMKERTSEMGGTLELESYATGGTQVRLTLPAAAIYASATANSLV
jgi:signal transduction histidine kinase